MTLSSTMPSSSSKVTIDEQTVMPLSTKMPSSSFDVGVEGQAVMPLSSSFKVGAVGQALMPFSTAVKTDITSDEQAVTPLFSVVSNHPEKFPTILEVPILMSPSQKQTQQEKN